MFYLLRLTKLEENFLKDIIYVESVLLHKKVSYQILINRPKGLNVQISALQIVFEPDDGPDPLAPSNLLLTNTFINYSNIDNQNNGKMKIKPYKIETHLLNYQFQQPYNYHQIFPKVLNRYSQFLYLPCHKPITNNSWTCSSVLTTLQLFYGFLCSSLSPTLPLWLGLGIGLGSGMRLTSLFSLPPPLEKACRL